MPTPEVRPPTQKRSRETLDRALAAGVALLREGGWDAVTVNEIGRRTGISRGAFYTRFTSKEALHLAVQDQVLETLEADQEQAFAGVRWQDLDAESAIGHAIGALCGIFERNGDLMHRMRTGFTPATLERAARAAETLDRQFTEALLSHREDFTVPDPEQAVRVCLHVIADTLIARRTLQPLVPSERQVSPRQLEQEFTLMMTRYLLAR